MDNTSGFTINGKVRLGEKAELPKLKIDVGYFGLQGTVESSDMIAFSLENGVKLGGGISEVDLKAKIVIAKGNQVASKFKNLGDCFLNDGAAPSYAGIRGLQLGEIKTFSKVAIDVKGSDLSVFAKKSESSSTSSTKVDLPDKAVKLKGIDLSIPSASEIFLAITATIANPFNIGLSLGAIEFAMLLDDNKLMTLSTAAFDLNRGLSDLDFSVRLTDVHDGGNGMSRKVATLAKYISEKSFPLDMKVGIQSLKLTRPNAVIDQFQDVTVKIPVSKLVKDKNQSASEKKVLDTSELFPSSASNTTKTTFNRFALEAAEGAKLKIAAEVIYQNAMKVSANVNFLSIITKIKEDTLADVNVDALKLSFQENLISPNVTIVFNKGKTNELLQDSVAQLVSEIQNERLVTKVGVNGFRFGSSDRPNNLFSEIALDLNSRISQESISNLNQKIKDIVKKLTDKSETKESSSTKLLLSKAHLLTKDSGAISLNVGAGIKDYKFPVSVSIGYFHVSNLINKLK